MVSVWFDWSTSQGAATIFSDAHRNAIIWNTSNVAEMIGHSRFFTCDVRMLIARYATHSIDSFQN